MSLTTLIIQILLTIPLTLILNYCKKSSNNKIEQILIPTVYIIIISALLPIVKENVFLIVVFELFIRNFYITNITTQNNNEGPKSFIVVGLLSIALSVFTYNYFISEVNTVIPNAEDIKPFIWFLIVLFIVNIYTKTNKEKEVKESKKTFLRKKEYIIMQYAKFKNIYSKCIETNKELIRNLVYAIMIYEDNRTPKIYRKINAYIGLVTKKETKYGIMQINSFDRLSDEDSIKKAIIEYESNFKEDIKDYKEQITNLLNTYNQNEKNEIISIYEEIETFNKI